MAQINDTNDSSSWPGCGVREALIHCWWSCKLVQPLQNSVWWFLKKIRMDLPPESAIPLTDIYQNDAPSYQRHLLNMFISTARNWNITFILSILKEQKNTENELDNPTLEEQIM